MSIRLLARVTGQLPESKVKHFWGLPLELSGGKDQRKQMRWPAVLLIESKADGIFLFRFAADGQCVGDTWHPTIGEAKQQASFEFEKTLSEWIQVPAEIKDAIAFGLSVPRQER